MKDSRLKDDVRKWLMGLFRDPIVKTLLDKGSLTKIQLETFLIDVLSEKISGRIVTYDKKAKLRLVKSGVSRGAFNRTLAQARRNIIRSMYTVILLGYLGVFDNPRLDPYVEIGNKIRTYAEAYQDAWKDRRVRREHVRIINMLQKEITESLERLSQPKAMAAKS